MSLLSATPAFDSESIESFVLVHYGIQSVARPLPSERDQNFLLDSGNQRFVVKIANGSEEPEFLDAQNKVLQHLDRQKSFCPHVVKTLNREAMTQIASPFQSHFLRVVTYIPGTPLAESEQFPELLFDLGKKLAQIDNALAEFDHPALHRNFHWDLSNGVSVIREHSGLIRDLQLRATVENYVRHFESCIAPFLKELPRSVIHADANDHNVLVSEDGQRIVGLIDFGDMVHSYTLADLAIAMAYTMLGKKDPIESASHVVGGYNSECALSDYELEVLFGFTKLRLCMSVCLAAFQHQQRPENSYLDISQQAIRKELPLLMRMDDQEVAARFRDARESVRSVSE